MYLAEISSANVRGSLVALQQLSITLGVSLRTIPITARTKAEALLAQILVSCTSLNKV